MTEINRNSFGKADEETTVTFADLWRLVWDHKWWYVLSLAICLVIAAFYMYRTPATYVIQSKVLVDESTQDAAMRNLGVATAGMMRVRSFNSVENEIETFSSPDLMQIVVERLGLETSYMEQQPLRNVELYDNSPVEMRLTGGNPLSGFTLKVTDEGDGTISLSDFHIREEKIKGKMKCVIGDTVCTPVGNLVLYRTCHDAGFRYPVRIEWSNSMAVAKSYCRELGLALSGKESSVIVLSMHDTYPKRSSAIISTLVDVYNETWVSDRNRSVIKTNEFITERLGIIERELGAVEEALKNYKSSNNLTDIKAVAQTYIDESSHYATKAFEVNNQLSIAKYIREHLTDPANSMSLIPSNIGLAESAVELQIREYNELLLQRDRLSVGSTENNPLIADLNSSLSSIRSAIMRSVDNFIATLELQLAKIESQEKQILGRMSSSSGQELQLLSIERQQQMTQDLYMFLLQKREENELAALVNVGNTRVLMRPNGPDRPVAPNLVMILAAAQLLGICIPFAYFFIRKISDKSVRSREDIANLSVPFLAEIPQRPAGGAPVIVEAGKRDMMNEAFRVLRTNVDLMLGRGEGSKVLMFTSFLPGAGKTFNVMNLAAGMALKGASVLLVDLDLRKSSLSRLLDRNHSGVTAFLNGKNEDYRTNIDKISDNLYFLPVGTLPPNPTELLLSDRFKTMIEQMRQDYDYVFLDCPPVDIVADSNIITTYADMTVFVLRAGVTRKEVLGVLEEMYGSGKFSHMALILNGVDMKQKAYGYGRMGYGYGNQDEVV